MWRLAMATHKLYIGDNSEVLDELREKVDVIYSDPVYAAPNKAFKNYDDMSPLWLNKLSECLIKSKEIMANDGVIFISIGETQVCRLKLVCDAIFGIENKIAMVAVKTPNQTENTNIIKNTDYLLIYGQSKDSKLNFESKTQEARCTTGRAGQRIVTIDIHAGIRVEVDDGVYTDEDIFKTGGNEDLTLKKGPIVVENKELMESIQLRGRWSNPNDVRAWLKVFKKEVEGPVYNKFGKELIEFYLCGKRFQPRMIKSGYDKMCTCWPQFLTKGSTELKEEIGENEFTYPKSVDFVKYIISIGTKKKDAVILDYYAGSGTTLEAVARFNDEQGTDMTAILVTNDEKDIWKDVTLQRIRTLNDGIRPDGTVYSDGLNFGYKVIKLDKKQSKPEAKDSQRLDAIMPNHDIDKLNKYLKKAGITTDYLTLYEILALTKNDEQ